MNAENSAISKKTIAFGLSLALCSVLNAILVIAKEKSKGVSDLMQRITGHHWITHAALICILFVIFGFVFSGTNNSQKPELAARRLTNIVLGGVIASVVIILGFYLIAD